MRLKRRRVSTNKRLTSIGLVCLLVTGGFAALMNFGSDKAQGTDVSGTIINDTTWDLAGSPYIVIDNVLVANGATLTIEPGVLVKFNGDYRLVIEGNLTAIGTETDRINITSNLVPSNRGDWRSIDIRSTGHAEIKHCNISYGHNGIVLDSSSNNNITNNSVILNSDNGIYLSYSQRNNIFGNKVLSNANYGILMEWSSTNNITDNDILSNSHYGLYLESSRDNNITGNNISSNGKGIYLGSSLRNNIVVNIVSNNFHHGIYVVSSNENKFANNVASSNREFAIYLHSSARNNVTGNIMIKNGILIKGGLLEHWNTHNIDTSNTVNGKPVYYWKNQIGGTIPPGAGQVILANCTDVIVKNQELTNCSVSIELGFSSNCDIIGNNASWNYAAPIPSDNYGLYLYRSNGNHIIGNNASSNDFGIRLEFSNWNNIIDNKFIGLKASPPSASIGISLRYSSSNNSFTGNYVSENQQDITLYGQCNDNNIMSNYLHTKGGKGIIINRCNRTTVTDNTIFLNYSWIHLSNTGIYVEVSSGNNITGNTIFSNNHPKAAYGIHLAWSKRNTIMGNNVFWIPYEGIYLHYSGGNNITGNDVSDCGKGLSLYWSFSNNIFKNTLSRNSYGIHIDDSSDNLLYRNNMIDNTNQAYDEPWDNYWDNGYPSGGNYWSDFDEPSEGAYDDYKGPDQNVLEGDGIVDKGIVLGGGKNPYVIDSNSQDNYPLIDPAQRYLQPPTLYINISPDGKDVILSWDPPPALAFDPYWIYRSTDPNNFDFSKPWINTSKNKEPGELFPIPDRTTWNDTNAAFPGNLNYKERYYYTIRAYNDRGQVSRTSRTVGKWTKMFPKGVSAFSLPLEPLGNMTVDYYLTDMKAQYIKWMNQTTNTWMKHGNGSINNTQMKLGEGYEVKFSNPTKYTFTGMPGTMISYDENSRFSGFNPAVEAKKLTVTVEPTGDVNLSWQEPTSMGPGDWYEVYYSNKRDGFFGTPNVDYYPVCPLIYFGNNTTTHNGALADDPGARLYYMVVPFNAMGIRGASTYSIGIWTEEYLSQYDTIGIPLKLSSNHTADWYCDNIPDTVGINYFIYSEQRWSWHSTRMPGGAYDTVLKMTEGYQISTSNATKFTFIGV